MNYENLTKADKVIMTKWLINCGITIKFWAIDQDLVEGYSWSPTSKGYLQAHPRNHPRIHKLIGERMGFFQDLVDHINRDKNNFCRDNFREVTNSQNLMNRGSNKIIQQDLKIYVKIQMEHFLDQLY